MTETVDEKKDEWWPIKPCRLCGYSVQVQDKTGRCCDWTSGYARRKRDEWLRNQRNKGLLL